MNPFLWKKAISDAWLQLVISGILLVLFGWVFVWLMSLFQVGAMETLLKMLPRFVEPMLGVPLGDLATTTGRLSVLFVHLVTQLICIGWAVGRGSDVVSGEISRGTMDLVLSLPIRRASLVVASAAVTAVGAVVLATSVWLGCWIGILTITFPQPAEPSRFLPGAMNLASMTFCLAGLTALLSSVGRDRWPTIWMAGGFYVLSAIIKMISRLWEPGAWLRYLSFLTAYEPQRLILLPAETTVRLGWIYNSTLLGIGIAAYAAAATVLSRRDIPAAK